MRHRVSPRRAAVLLVTAALLVLPACGSPAAELSSQQVTVDTPALRVLKKDAGIPPCPATTAAPARDGLPDVTLPCLGGGTAMTMSRLRGPLVVNLWAQWCGPCREEMPYYAAFARKYAGKVAVLGIDSRDYQPRAALQLAKQEGVGYPLVSDQAPAIRGVGTALPQVILIDRSGRVAYQQAVQIKSVSQLSDLVGEYLGVHS